jgi:hypothetical protein
MISEDFPITGKADTILDNAARRVFGLSDGHRMLTSRCQLYLTLVIKNVDPNLERAGAQHPNR